MSLESFSAVLHAGGDAVDMAMLGRDQDGALRVGLWQLEHAERLGALAAEHGLVPTIVQSRFLQHWTEPGVPGAPVSMSVMRVEGRDVATACARVLMDWRSTKSAEEWRQWCVEVQSMARVSGASVAALRALATAFLRDGDFGEPVRARSLAEDTLACLMADRMAQAFGSLADVRPSSDELSAWVDLVEPSRVLHASDRAVARPSGPAGDAVPGW